MRIGNIQRNGRGLWTAVNPVFNYRCQRDKPGLGKIKRYLADLSGAFADRITIDVKGGRGGPGCCSFLRGPNQVFAPPDGGNGGDGGSVWIEVDSDAVSLRMSSHAFKAESGGRGSPARRRGKDGPDLIIPVPRGTIVREKRPVFTEEILEEDLELRELVFQEETEFETVMVCELNKVGQRVRIAQGGRGGRGNRTFKSSTNRAPQEFGPGKDGEARKLELELKCIADVGLVGFPNAGKSTFLRAVSKARPKVAAYPFTTLRPHIGVVQAISSDRKSDYRTITVADIPGLIEGAHENRGLGHDFLRHIERTSFLVYVLDVSESPDSVIGTLEMLKSELEMYRSGLSERNSCIVANKMDVGESAFGTLRHLIGNVGDSMLVFPISAQAGTGVESVVQYLTSQVLSTPVLDPSHRPYPPNGDGE